MEGPAFSRATFFLIRGFLYFNLMENKETIYGGAFQMARKTFESELWLYKPSSWFKIWIYILGHVNHRDKGKFKRGEGYFNFKNNLLNIGPDIKYDPVKKFLNFARKSSIISTSRSTRGIIIKVNNYNEYQTLDNYQSTSRSTSEAPLKHLKSTPINKNDKNVKNDKNNIAEASSAPEIIPDLLKDKQKHVQIVGLYAKAKKVVFNNKSQQSSFITRNIRPAKSLDSYKLDKIIETMRYLLQNADFKWTLESVGKYIDEDLESLNNKNKIIKV